MNTLTQTDNIQMDLDPRIYAGSRELFRLLFESYVTHELKASNSKYWRGIPLDQILKTYEFCEIDHDYDIVFRPNKDSSHTLAIYIPINKLSNIIDKYGDKLHNVKNNK